MTTPVTTVAGVRILETRLSLVSSVPELRLKEPAGQEVGPHMRRIGSIRPRKRPGHYAFASAIRQSADVTRLVSIRPRERRLRASYGHPRYLWL